MNKKVIFVSHCILNQAAKAKGRQRGSGSVKELLELFAESGVGIVQMPCPFLGCDGKLGRKPKLKEKHDTKKYRRHCKRLSSSLLKEIKRYLEENYKVLAVLGIELSPHCAVHQLQDGNKRIPGKGIFIEELEEEMKKKSWQVPIIGVDLNNLYSTMEKLQSLLKYS